MEREKGFRILNTSVKNLIWAPDVWLPGLVKDKTFWAWSNKDYYKSSMELTFSMVFETHSWFFLCSSELKGLLLIYRRRFIWLSHQKKQQLGNFQSSNVVWVPCLVKLRSGEWLSRETRTEKEKEKKKRKEKVICRVGRKRSSFGWIFLSPLKPLSALQTGNLGPIKAFPILSARFSRTGWCADCLKFHWKYFKTVLWLETSFFHLTPVLDPASSLEVMGKGSRRVCRCLISSSMQYSPSNFSPHCQVFRL